MEIRYSLSVTAVGRLQIVERRGVSLDELLDSEERCPVAWRLGWVSHASEAIGTAPIRRDLLSRRETGGVVDKGKGNDAIRGRALLVMPTPHCTASVFTEWPG